MAVQGKPDKNKGEDQIIELVKLFEGFSQASTEFTQSYRFLEKRISDLGEELQEQSSLLRQTETFLNSVLSNIPVGIVAITMDGTITLFNSNAEKITGLSSEAVTGHQYQEIFDLQHNDPTGALYTLTTGSLIESREKNLKHANGFEIPVRFWTSWLEGKNGTTIGVMEVFEDLSDLRELQKRIQQRDTLASLGEMAAQVAHEFRNPLAGVQGFAQFLLEDIPEDHPAYPTVGKIINGVKDIEQTAGRLLEFTRPLTPQLMKADIRDVLTNVSDLIVSEISISEKSVEFYIDLPEENVPVECDPTLLKQAFLNMSKNSLNAIKENGSIMVKQRWNLMKNKINIEISDTGCGIDPSQISRIFHPFFTTRTRGTGLGLSLVKKIIDVHEGSINVNSTVGEGTRFIIELPITRFS